jgi:RNA processing factor Prp31
MGDDFAEYKEREEKVEKLISKGYQSKIRNDDMKFRQHIQMLDSQMRGEPIKQFENLSHKEVAQQLIVQTNDYLKHIDNDILIVHKELRDAYAFKFSELESIILNPIDYAKAVRIIGNTQGDISQTLEKMSWLSN